MTPSDIPQDVLDFINRKIDSVPHLEALLLLWQAPDRAWSEDEIAARVYVSREQARVILQDLARHGLVAHAKDVPDRYGYHGAWDGGTMMQRVASTYRHNLVPMASLIHGKAASHAVREFARAFEIKKKE
jgi:hypothetical protein